MNESEFAESETPAAAAAPRLVGIKMLVAVVASTAALASVLTAVLVVRLRPAAPAAVAPANEYPSADDLDGKVLVRIAGMATDAAGYCDFHVEYENKTSKLLTTLLPQFAFYNRANQVLLTEAMTVEQLGAHTRQVVSRSLSSISCGDIARVEVQGIRMDIWGAEICEYDGSRHMGCLEHVAVAPSGSSAPALVVAGR